MASELDAQRWRSRFHSHASEYFSFRLHMTVLLGLVGITGWGSGRIFLAMGLVPLGWRYVASFLVAYLSFFLYARIWMSMMSSQLQAMAAAQNKPADPDTAPLEAAGEALNAAHGTPASSSSGSSSYDLGGVDLFIPTGNSGSSGGSSSFDLGSSGGGGGGGGGGGSFLDLGSGGDGEGCAVILLVGLLLLAVAVIFGGAVYAVWEAPILLGEPLFELVLAAALLRGTRKATRSAVEHDGWAWVLARSTAIPFALVLVVTAAFGFAAQSYCPTALTGGQVVRLCILAPPGERAIQVQ